MNVKLFWLSCLLLLLSCKKEVQPQNAAHWTQLTERISYLDENQYFKFQSGRFSYHISKSELPLKKVILLNSSLLGYFLELGAEDQISGVSSVQYIYSEKIHHMLQNNKIADVGNEQKYNIEKILALKPNAIFTNYVESFENTYDVLRKNGINIIFIDEYLEQKPLQKAKIILLLGKLLGKDVQATAHFQQVKKEYEKFTALAASTKEKPGVIANEMYGAQWFLPGGQTTPADYFKDAHAAYILADNKDDKSVPKSFEEIFVKAENAKYWVNLSDFKSKKELLAINPNYAKMKVFQQGKLYSLYGKVRGNGNDYFESGTVHPEIILKDYIKIFHPELFPEYTLTYMKEIQ